MKYYLVLLIPRLNYHQKCLKARKNDRITEFDIIIKYDIILHPEGDGVAYIIYL